MKAPLSESDDGSSWSSPFCAFVVKSPDLATFVKKLHTIALWINTDGLSGSRQRKRGAVPQGLCSPVYVPLGLFPSKTTVYRMKITFTMPLVVYDIMNTLNELKTALLSFF